MVVEVTESQVLEMLQALHPCANATGMNGPASYMLAQELYALGKPLHAITLGEVSSASDRVDKRYHAMTRRLKDLDG